MVRGLGLPAGESEPAETLGALRLAAHRRTPAALARGIVTAQRPGGGVVAEDARAKRLDESMSVLGDRVRRVHVVRNSLAWRAVKCRIVQLRFPVVNMDGMGREDLVVSTVIGPLGGGSNRADPF